MNLGRTQSEPRLQKPRPLRSIKKRLLERRTLREPTPSIALPLDNRQVLHARLHEARHGLAVMRLGFADVHGFQELQDVEDVEEVEAPEIAVRPAAHSHAAQRVGGLVINGPVKASNCLTAYWLTAVRSTGSLPARPLSLNCSNENTGAISSAMALCSSRRH